MNIFFHIYKYFGGFGEEGGGKCIFPPLLWNRINEPTYFCGDTIADVLLLAIQREINMTQ
jgi:hypothetical protein